MKPLRTLLPTIVAALVCASAISASAQNPYGLVNNGGFEDAAGPSFPGWTLNNPSGDTIVAQNFGSFIGAREGSRYAYLGTEFEPAVGSFSTLSQMISTAPGGTYTFSFSLANDNDQNPPSGVEDFRAFFNNVQLTLTLPQRNAGYTDFTFPGLVASGSETEIRFEYRHDNDGFRLDNVAVVPEPSTLSLLAMSVGGGLAFLYRRSRRNGRQAAAQG
jgi:hypothetical protein